LRLHELKFYSIADAKAHFSQVVDESHSTDVIITKNGVPVAVVIDYEKYVAVNKFIEQTRDLYLMDAGEEAVRLKFEDILVQLDKNSGGELDG